MATNNPSAWYTQDSNQVEQYMQYNHHQQPVGQQVPNQQTPVMQAQHQPQYQQQLTAQYPPQYHQHFIAQHQPQHHQQFTSQHPPQYQQQFTSQQQPQYQQQFTAQQQPQYQQQFTAQQQPQYQQQFTAQQQPQYQPQFTAQATAQPRGQLPIQIQYQDNSNQDWRSDFLARSHDDRIQFITDTMLSETMLMVQRATMARVQSSLLPDASNFNPNPNPNTGSVQNTGLQSNPPQNTNTGLGQYNGGFQNWQRRPTSPQLQQQNFNQYQARVQEVSGSEESASGVQSAVCTPMLLPQSLQSMPRAPMTSRLAREQSVPWVTTQQSQAVDTSMTTLPDTPRVAIGRGQSANTQQSQPLGPPTTAQSNPFSFGNTMGHVAEPAPEPSAQGLQPPNAPAEGSGTEASPNSS